MRYSIKNYPDPKWLDNAINPFGFGWMTNREICQLLAIALGAFSFIYGSILAIGCFLGFL